MTSRKQLWRVSAEREEMREIGAKREDASEQGAQTRQMNSIHPARDGVAQEMQTWGELVVYGPIPAFGHGGGENLGNTLS